MIRRADLLAVIAAGLPAERIHLGHRLIALADRGDPVEARFANGASVAADVLIGADGIHSTVRALLFGEQAPRFVGCVAYRGLVPIERVADPDLARGSCRARRLPCRHRRSVAALKRYEQLRLPRVTRLQAMSRANKTRFHLRDGPEQQARDAAWAKSADRSPQALRWLYGFDAGALAPADA
jgi:2-polyprenyl-6-methoxyphenol hydroxylase-like FAD-dependent oxidoreductase